MGSQVLTSKDMIDLEELIGDLGDKVSSPKKEKKDDWDEELQRRYDKGKFSYKPWIYGE